MFYLVNRSNKELTCFPAIPTIARETGLSERTVLLTIRWTIFRSTFSMLEMINI